MDTEIELKFLTSKYAQSALPKLVEQFAEQHQVTATFKGEVHLTNTYYDTPDKRFRAEDIGFRVRGADGAFEQTIKTAGKVVGGLHQRPEYNVAITNSKPNLALFDSQVLPQSLSCEQLQAQIRPLFTTDFRRQKWLLSQTNGDVLEGFELVFDQGQIESEGDTREICELELELTAGKGDLLFAFAQTLVDAFALDGRADATEAEDERFIRLGFQSKAMRGYLLYNDEQMAQKAELEAVKLKQSDSLETAFIKTLEHGLNFMQHHEQCFIEEPCLPALRRFTDGAALIRHGLVLFNEVACGEQVEHFRTELKWILSNFGWVEHAKQLQTLKSNQGKFRKKLDKNAALSQMVDEEAKKDPKLEDIKAFFSHPRYIRLLLDLSRFLLGKTWRDAADFHHQTLPPGTLHETAGEMLSNAWQLLLNAMPKKQALSIDDYMFHHKQLKRSLLTGTSLGGLYINTLRDEFRLPWMDLSRGIDELKTLDLLKSLAVKLEQEQSERLLEWLDSQIETLLLAMEQSRRSAIKMKTYWSGV